ASSKPFRAKQKQAASLPRSIHFAREEQPLHQRRSPQTHARLRQQTPPAERELQPQADQTTQSSLRDPSSPRRSRRAQTRAVPSESAALRSPPTARRSRTLAHPAVLRFVSYFVLLCGSTDLHKPCVQNLRETPRLFTRFKLLLRIDDNHARKPVERNRELSQF